MIDLNKNTVDSFQTETQAELFQAFNGTSEEFWAVEEPIEESEDIDSDEEFRF